VDSTATPIQTPEKADKSKGNRFSLGRKKSTLMF